MPLNIVEIQSILDKLEYPNSRFDVLEVHDETRLALWTVGFWNLDNWAKDREVIPETKGGVAFRVELHTPTANLLSEYDVLRCFQQLLWLIAIHEVDEFFYYEGTRIFDPHNPVTRQPRQLSFDLKNL